jgi:HK97 family phage major capsid protein
MDEILKELKASLIELKASGDRIKGDFAGNTAKLAEIEKAQKSAIESVEKRISEVEEKIKESSKHSVSGFDDDAKAVDKFAISNLMKALHVSKVKRVSVESVLEKLAPYEFEVLKNIQKQANEEIYRHASNGVVDDEMLIRSQNSTTPADGGLLIPTALDSIILDTYAKPMMPLLNGMGLRVATGLIGSLDLNNNEGGVLAYMVGEEEAPTESKRQISQKTMSPHKVAALVKASNRLIYQTSNAIETMIRMDIGEALAKKLHSQLISGTGLTVNIKGLEAYADGDFTATSDIGANGGALTYAKLEEMVANLELADKLYDNSSTRFFTRPDVLRILRKDKIPMFSGDTAGMPYMNSGPMLKHSDLENLVGYGIGRTTQFTTATKASSTAQVSSVYLGDWSRAILGQWRGSRIAMSEHAGFTQDQTWFLGLWEFDFLLRDAKAFTRIKDALTLVPNA